MIQYILNKNTIITSNPGGGSTTLALYYANILAEDYNVLYYDTGFNIDRSYIQQHYPNVYDKCVFYQGSNEHFFNYLLDLEDTLEYFDYIIFDTADVFGKKTLNNLNELFELYNVHTISTSQLRVNPGTGKPYSTVEEWNRQLSQKIYDYSIWIRNVNEPNQIYRRKYIDIFKYYRVGNRYDARFLLNFDKKRGNII